MPVDKNMQVLVVDGYASIRRIVRTLLNEIGFSNIDEAHDGQQALTMCGEKKYGLVISDWSMQPMTGLEFLKGLRTSANDNKSVPFILMTAESKSENIIAAKEAGVNNCIVKPFNAETFKTKISAVLGQV